MTALYFEGRGVSAVCGGEREVTRDASRAREGQG